MENKQLCGFINVLKPPGMSSAQVVGYVRWLLDGAKVGHAGTLDPEAAGVLPLMVGKAARLFDYMQDKEKAYIAEAAFGAATDTQDAQGTVLETGTSYPGQEDILGVLPQFTGSLMQRPPIFSALKQDGKRLYQLARSGQTADIPLREVQVHALTLAGLTENHGALLHVRCSKGFYVRTLCYDLGRALGCPSHMRFLLRTKSGAFTLDTAVPLERLTDVKKQGTIEQLILPPKTALGHLPDAKVPPQWEKAMRNGIKLPWRVFAGELAQTKAENGCPACLWMNGELCAIGQRSGDELKLRTWLGE